MRFQVGPLARSTTPARVAHPTGGRPFVPSVTMTAAEHQPVWLRPPDVAALYDVALDTVYSWVRRGHTTRAPDGRIDWARLDRNLKARATEGNGSGFQTGARRVGSTIDEQHAHAD